MPAATTYNAVRVNQVAVIEQLSLAIYSGKTLTAYNGPDFRTWAEANTRSCLRRFVIQAISSEAEPGVTSDGVVRRSIVRSTVSVAYPLNLSGYGQDQVYDLEAMLFSDAEQIRAAIGIVGDGNYVSGQIITEASSYSIEEIEGAKLLVFDLTTRLYVSATGGAVVQSSNEQSFQFTTTTEADSYTVTLPYAAVDSSYAVSVAISTLPGDDGFPHLKPGVSGRTNYSFILDASGLLPIGTVIDVIIRDA